MNECTYIFLLWTRPVEISWNKIIDMNMSLGNMCNKLNENIILCVHELAL